MRRILIGVALSLAAPSAGWAQETDGEKFNFFSQPSLSRAQVLADFDECRDLASAVQPPQPGYTYTPNIVAAAAVGMVQGFMKGAQRRHMFDAALRKCMSIKGYGRYALTKEQAKAIYAGSWQQMRERLADRALAPIDGLTRIDP